MQNILTSKMINENSTHLPLLAATAVADDKIYGTGAKPKVLSIPSRILDEEVWLSGSELKTDNSSSDEEKFELKQKTEYKMKKEFKKKIKSFNAIVTQTNNESTMIEKISENIEEIQTTTTTTTVATTEQASSLNSGNYEQIIVENVQWRPKRGSVTIIPGLTTELENTYSEMIEEFLEVNEYSDGENISEKYKEIESSNQADNQSIEMESVMTLDDRILKAEKIYMETRRRTDQMVCDLIKFLEQIKFITDPEWKYLIELTKRWINIFTSDNPNQEFEKSFRNTITSYAERTKNKTVKRAVRKISKYSVSVKNVKQSNNNRRNVENKSSNNSLNILMKQLEDRSKEIVYHKPYKFTEDEKERITQIDERLALFKSCTSLDDFNVITDSNSADKKKQQQKQYQEIQQNHQQQKQSKVEYKNLSLTDSEKRQFYNLPSSSGSSNTSDNDDDDTNQQGDDNSDGSEQDDNFESCEEDFHSSRIC